MLYYWYWTYKMMLGIFGPPERILKCPMMILHPQYLQSMYVYDESFLHLLFLNATLDQIGSYRARHIGAYAICEIDQQPKGRCWCLLAFRASVVNSTEVIMVSFKDAKNHQKWIQGIQTAKAKIAYR